jgi:hypothetical protein
VSTPSTTTPSASTTASTSLPQPDAKTVRIDRSGLPAACGRSGSGNLRSATTSAAAAAADKPGTARQPTRSATTPAPTVAMAMPVADAVSTSETGRWRVAAGHTSPT